MLPEITVAEYTVVELNDGPSFDVRDSELVSTFALVTPTTSVVASAKTDFIVLPMLDGLLSMMVDKFTMSMTISWVSCREECRTKNWSHPNW